MSEMEAQEPAQFKKPRGSNSPNKRCCYLVVFIIFLVLALLTAAILLILFVLKPKKPIFHLNSINVDDFKLNVSSPSKEVSVSYLTASLLFISQNPNKLGIKYSSAELVVLYETRPVGTVDVPTFYQPANSTNVTVTMYVSIQQFNLSGLIDGTHVEVQILGGIGVQAHVLNFPLPRIKVIPFLS